MIWRRDGHYDRTQWLRKKEARGHVDRHLRLYSANELAPLEPQQVEMYVQRLAEGAPQLLALLNSDAA
jgi:hypothetical protein